MPIVVVALVAIIAIAFSLRIVADSERLAVFVLGRFAGLKGPGLVFLLPGGVARAARVRIGDRGELVAPQTVRLGEHDLPADSASQQALGSGVRVVGFTDTAVSVAADSATQHVCPKCGYSF